MQFQKVRCASGCGQHIFELALFGDVYIYNVQRQWKFLDQYTKREGMTSTQNPQTGRFCFSSPFTYLILSTILVQTSLLDDQLIIAVLFKDVPDAANVVLQMGPSQCRRI